MDYCKEVGIPPAQSWAWNIALKAYNKYKEAIKHQET